jgi:hypothetical protein
VRYIEEHPARYKLHLHLQVDNLDPGGPAYDYYLDRHRYDHQALADIVRRGQERGEIRPDADPARVRAAASARTSGRAGGSSAS